MKGNAIKRIVAAAVAITVVGTNLPSGIGINGLIDGFTLKVNAEGEHTDAAAVFGETEEYGHYQLSSQTYKLGSDITTAARIVVPNGVSAVVDLDGHTINRGLNEYTSEGSVFCVEEGGSLTVLNGTVRGGAADFGGGFLVRGELVLENVNVTGNKAEAAGGGIFIGGAKASAKLVGSCTVSGNYASENGSGIYVEEESLLGIQGKPVIADNEGGNVYLPEGRRIDVTGALEEGTNVFVTYSDEGRAALTNNYSKYNTSSPEGFFTNERGGIMMLNGDEVWTAFEYEARSWNEKQKKCLTATKTVFEFSAFDNMNISEDDTYDIANGWCVLRQDVHLDKQVRCFGNVNILLCDGAALYCDKGIDCSDDSKLSIYGQQNDSGKLESKVKEGAAIGAARKEHTCGEINIFGGTVKAQSSDAAGIGGTYEAAVEKDINIYGGKITAQGGKGAAGIGSAENMKSAVRIYGGEVNAAGGTLSDSKEKTVSGAGIGSGSKKAFDGKVIVYGGTVSAVGGDNASGIGAGFKGKMNGDIRILGGTVTAKGKGLSNGIGAGERGSVTGSVTVNGGKVTAVSGTSKDAKKAADIQAIGYAAGISKLVLGSGVTVSVNNTKAIAAQRVAKIAEAYASGETPATVVISECDKHEYTYTVDLKDKTKHIGECKYCGGTVTEAHTHKSEKDKCSVCGYTDEDSVYTLTVAVNSGKEDSTEKIGVVKDKKYTLHDCTVVPEYYVFKGWKLGEDTKLRQPGEEITVTGDIKITAEYAPVNYAVTYELGSGTNDEKNPVEYTAFDEDIKLADASGDTDFLGWYDNEEFKGEPVSVIKKGSHENITLYAKWSDTKTAAKEEDKKDAKSADKTDISAAKITMVENTADVAEVVLGDKTLKAGEDYTVSYLVGTEQISKPTVPGTFTAVISGAGSYEGKAEQKFTIAVQETKTVEAKSTKAKSTDVEETKTAAADETMLELESVDYEAIQNPTVTFEKGNGCVKLNWDEIEGVNKYAVCRYVGGKWQKFEEGYGTSYVLNDLKSGVDYRVAIIAFVNGHWKTDFSNAVTVTPRKTNKYPQLTAMLKGDKYVLTWTEVTGAEKYAIAVNTNGEWRIAEGSLSPTTFKYTTPRLCRGVHYKVAAVAKVNGEWDLSRLTSKWDFELYLS
ncbi:InlB B-repeat-containing protein [uncultured Ruminococcus sp.]|uniref:InlB B-repeat-containing protein n=1 Tax=uncultured Ruminococcus sp. TaxID=165186 RepID=UPI0025FFCC9C|nr:InlB B-repeat-containing protein [uncultured Ruminococcus sp.]